MYTLRDRLHAPCTLQAESVHGACKEVCTRLHACTPRKTHAHRPLQSLQDGSNQAAPTPSAGYAPRKVLISSGIWRTISENPCQKISKYCPNLTKYKHTKRAVQTGGIHPPPPSKRRKWPGRGEGVHTPENECTRARFVCLQGSGERRSAKTLENSDGSDGKNRVAPSQPSQDLNAKEAQTCRKLASVASIAAVETPPAPTLPTQELSVKRSNPAEKPRRYRRYRRWRGRFTDHTDDTDDKFEREELKVCNGPSGFDPPRTVAERMLVLQLTRLPGLGKCPW